jgi:hypothetical protein
MTTRFFYLILIIPIFLTSCLKDVSPSDALTTGTLTGTVTGMKNALNGAYALFKDHVTFNGVADANNMYLRQYFQMSDFASDDIVCGQTTTDPLYYSFSLQHTPTQTNSRYFWYISYKIISDANTVIEAAANIANPTDEVKQLVGECYFLRAFATFNLSRFYAKPYTQDPTAAGVVLRTSTSEPSAKARATVGETYAQVIADATMAASLMNTSRGVQFASKEAAYALLSRVYLYEDNTDSTIYYSSQVINSGRFNLETASGFTSMFANATSSAETIFCVAFTTNDDYGKAGSIASMIYTDGNSGWGEEFASKSLRDSMADQAGDVRAAYIVPFKDGDGNVMKKNGIEMYMISKFSFQGNSPTLSSPIMFRLAEMYLNRAEAEAKAGNTSAALADVNKIRENRGLANNLVNAVPTGKTLLDVVLKERRIELAFEGHRALDVYRNKRALNRTYWGYHLAGLKESDIDLSAQPANYDNMIINWDNTKTIYYIPIDEIQTNTLCTQNP